MFLLGMLAGAALVVVLLILLFIFLANLPSDES
jgi:hypothetical protein